MSFTSITDWPKDLTAGETELLREVALALRTIRYGSVVLTVHDGRFVELEEKAAKGENAEKYVWMVHSGGFYLVEKQKRPQMMPQTLHWFRWEAAFTWLTGILLFTVVYYRGGALFKGDDESISNAAAIWRQPRNPVPSSPPENPVPTAS